MALLLCSLVSFHVLMKWSFTSVLDVALWTMKWFLRPMHWLVNLQYLTAVGRIAAKIALVSMRIRMASFMVTKTTRAWETSATYFTFIRPFFQMSSLMTSQRFFRLEARITLWALKRSIIGVDDLMLVKRFSIISDVITFIALKAIWVSVAFFVSFHIHP